MRNRRCLNNVLSTDRKTLYMILSIVMVSVLTLTVVYAALSTTLNINGNAEVSAASWDIYLDNVVLNSSSATSNVPTITNKTTASFSATLNEPGDFYEFTIDVVNNGSIDAMIDSVTKTPELSDTQKKYLNYIIEYENGEAITTKQLVSKNSLVRLKVKVEYRKDISSSDLPIVSETLDLSFTVNYVQADETSNDVVNGGFKSFNISGTVRPLEPVIQAGWVDIVIEDISTDRFPVTLYYYVKGASEDDSAYTLKATKTLVDTYTDEYGYSGFQSYGQYVFKIVAVDAYGVEDSIELTFNLSCFLAGTQVYTETGLVNIENIKVGDYIYAYNLTNSEKLLRKVVDVHEGYSNEIYEITVGAEIIKVTPLHKFYVVNKGWVRACDLVEGDYLNSVSGNNRLIEKIEYKSYDEPLKVYNLTVDEVHNYLVTEYQLLVHNLKEPL